MTSEETKQFNEGPGIGAEEEEMIKLVYEE